MFLEGRFQIRISGPSGFFSVGSDPVLVFLENRFLIRILGPSGFFFSDPVNPDPPAHAPRALYCCWLDRLKVISLVPTQCTVYEAIAVHRSTVRDFCA